MAETADEIKSEIERTRARMSDTIDSLEWQIWRRRRRAAFVAGRWALYAGAGAGAALLALLALRAWRAWS